MSETHHDGDSDFEFIEYCGRLSCRKPILQTTGRGRPREFCSETCRRGADREYKRAKALVESFERNLRNFRHEVATYGRKAEEDLATPEDQELIHRNAVAAISRARAVVEYSVDAEDRYLAELSYLLDAVEPMVSPAVAT